MNNHRQIRILTLSCCIVYFAAYMARSNFGALIAQIVASRGILKSEAGIVTTAAFFTYAIGQIISGVLGDRFDARKVLAIGLIASAAINALMPFCTSIALMAVLWGINGLMQSFIWPPMAKLLAVNLTEIMFKKTCINLVVFGYMGTFAVYALSPLLIRTWGWESVFFFTAVAAALVGLFWCVGTRGAETHTQAEKAKEKTPKLSMRVLINSGVAVMFVILFCAGLLRDGITTWMPSFMSENFGIDTAHAIFMTALLPLITVISLKVFGFLHTHYIRNEIFFTALVFSGAFICTALAVIFRTNAFFGVAAMAMTIAFLQGACSMLASMVPPWFLRYGCISMLAGALNLTANMGSTVSSYGFALISENFGWVFTQYVWCAIALVGTLLSFATLKPWTAFRERMRK